MNNDPSNMLPAASGTAQVVPLRSELPELIDPLLQELQVTRLEGRYFCFDKHEAKRRTGVYEYRDGNRSVVIDVHPRSGHPSILAYKILQVLFRKLTHEGKPYPDSIALSHRELVKLVGRVYGGRDSKDIYQAIRQLRDTRVELVLHDPENPKEFRKFDFNLLISSSLVGSGEVTQPTHIRSAVLTLHPVIMDSIRAGHLVIFNWARLANLEPIAATLYKRVYLNFITLYENKYDRRGLRFEKDYETLCGEWLGGLKPERYKSRILQQLGRYLDELREIGLISSCVVEKKKNGEGFKLAFRPNEGFFFDYDNFFKGHGRARVLQFQQASDRALLTAPVAIVTYFYQKLHGVEKLEDPIFSEKDVQFAGRLMEQLGEARLRDLIDYAIEEAPKTHFEMKTLRAVEHYLPSWQIQREQRTQKIRAQEDRERRQKEEKLRSDYEAFCRALCFEYLQRCAERERNEIRSLAIQQLPDSVTPESPLRNMSITMHERQIVLDRVPHPSFEEWLERRR
jgi:hypothetical protein